MHESYTAPNWQQKLETINGSALHNTTQIDTTHADALWPAVELSAFSLSHYHPLCRHGPINEYYC